MSNRYRCGAGGVYAAADGVFYIVLKEDYAKNWVAGYLKRVAEAVAFETSRWKNGKYTVELRRECLNTVTYMNGTLAALQQASSSLSDEINAIKDVLKKYQASFYSEALASSQFDVREVLHVSPLVGPWTDSSDIVATILERGEQNSSAHLFPALFEKTRVLIYNGIYDMDCNFMGTDNWLSAISWSGSQQFNALPRKPWLEGDRIHGQYRAFGNVTQVPVNGAGHLVPMDQPQTALKMLGIFLNKQPF